MIQLVHRIGDHDKIRQTRFQPLDGGGGVVRGDFKGDAGIVAVKCLDHGDDAGEKPHLAGSDVDAARVHGLEILQVVLGFGNVLHRLRHVVQHNGGFRREGYALLGAYEQLDAQLRLQRLDIMADRGLGEMEHLRSQRKTLILCDIIKDLVVFKIDCHFTPPPYKYRKYL